MSRDTYRRRLRHWTLIDGWLTRPPLLGFCPHRRSLCAAAPSLTFTAGGWGGGRRNGWREGPGGGGGEGERGQYGISPRTLRVQLGSRLRRIFADDRQELTSFFRHRLSVFRPPSVPYDRIRLYRTLADNTRRLPYRISPSIEYPPKSCILSTLSPHPWLVSQLVSISLGRHTTDSP